jgi:hypothetical protein
MKEKWNDSDDDEISPVFALERYVLVSEWHGIPYEPPVVAKHLIRLYDQIISAKLDFPLLDCLRITADRPSQRPLTTQDDPDPV